MYLEQSALLKFSLKGKKNKLFLFKHSKHKTDFVFREKIAQWMVDILDDATDPWGVKVERVEMYVHIF